MLSCLAGVLDSSKSRIHCIAHCCPVNNIKNFRTVHIPRPTIEMHEGLLDCDNDKLIKSDRPGNSGR